ncbi:nitroreductase family protein [Rhizomicrobium palustre]|nr:nitroreductase family protein [Rhizomicrobium palustre]
MGLTAVAKTILPKPFRNWLKGLNSTRLLAQYSVYDFNRFHRHSSAGGLRGSLAHEDAEMTKTYHAIEKGLSLPVPRPGFGAIVVSRLANTLARRIRNNGPWTPACAHSLNALSAYLRHAREGSAAIPKGVEEVLSLAAERGLEISGKPTKPIRREDVEAATSFDAERFFWSRHSVRQFSDEALEAAFLLKAIDMARSTPSVCNRQSGRVHIFMKPEDKERILRHQNGNRGFGDTAGAILVVTSDLSAFVDPSERYQAWIDGGMFAMTITLALHALGLGSCCLNWSSPPQLDKALHRDGSIPAGETVIMLLAVGRLRESFAVATSDRLPVSEIARVIQ